MGSADIYCLICGGPTYSKDVITKVKILKKYLRSSMGKYYGVNPNGMWSNAEQVLEGLDHLKYNKHRFSEKEYEELENSIKTPSNFKWQDKLIMMTPNKVVKNVKSSGEVYVTDKNGTEYYPYPYIYEEDNYGYVMHVDCYKVASSKYGKFGFDDIKINEKIADGVPSSINYGEIEKYQGQFFHHALAYIDNPEVLESPLKNDKNRKRILKIKLPIRKKKSGKASSRKKKSKEGSRKSSRVKGDRPSPSQSATKYKIGTNKKGNDNNMWIIAVNKNGTHRWKKL